MNGYLNGYKPVKYRYEVRAVEVDGANLNGTIRRLGQMLWIEPIEEASEHFSWERHANVLATAIDCVRSRRYSVLLGHRRVTAGAGFVAEYEIVPDADTPKARYLDACDRMNLQHEAGKDVPIEVVK